MSAFGFPPPNDPGLSPPSWLLGGINVKAQPYNAKGDADGAGNGTDDTAAIQAAITAAINAGGGIIYFPSGQYRISGQLRLLNAQNVTLRGAGRASSKLLFDDVNVGSGGVELANSAYISTISADIAEDAITATLTSNSGAAVGLAAMVRGVAARGGFWAGIIRNVAGNVITLDSRSMCAFTAAENAVTTILGGGGAGGTSGRNITIEHLGFGPVNATAPLATRTTYIYALYALRLRIRYCRFEGMVHSAATNADTMLISNSLDVTVEHNECDSIGGTASLNYDLSSVQNAKILHNRARNCTVGISLTGCPGATVFDNHLFGSYGITGGVTATRGIKILAGSNRSKIESNTIDGYNIDNNGIFLVDSARCIIARNHISNCGNVGINLAVNSAGDNTWSKYNQVVDNHIHNISHSSTSVNGIGISATFGAAGSVDAFTKIMGNYIDGCGGNGIVAGNQKDQIIGNIIRNYGMQLATVTSFNGAIGIYLSGGRNVVAFNIIDNSGNANSGKAIYSLDESASNWVYGNTLSGGDTDSLNVADITAVQAT